MCCHLFGIIGKRQIYNALTILCLYMKTIEIEDGYFFSSGSYLVLDVSIQL